MTIAYNTSTVEYDNSNFNYDGTGINNLADLPVLGVFMAFDSGVYDADPDWLEITPYVRSVQIQRGRNDELEPFQGGKATVVLDNRTRLFDPFNTAGAYYGKLLPRKQIRIVAQNNGVNYGLFRGFVSGFPVEWTDAGKDSTVTVDCFDLVALLGAEVVSTDLLSEYITSLNALSFIKNDVKQNSNTASNAGGVTITSTQPDYGIAGGTELIIETVSVTGSNAGSGSVNTGDNIMGLTTNPSLTVTGNNLASVDICRNLVVGDTGVNQTAASRTWSLVFWVKIDPTMEAPDNWSGAPNIAQLLLVDYAFENSGTVERICLNLNSTYAPVGTIMVFNYGVTTASSFQAVNDGKPHCVAITFDKVTGLARIFIDGIDTTLTQNINNAADGLIGRARLMVRGSTQSVNYGYTAIFKGILTNSQIETLAAYGNNNFPEPADDRFDRLISLSNLPIALTETDPAFTYQTMQDFPKLGTVLLPALQQLATSEGSSIFVDRDGVLQFFARNTIFSEATSGITYADDGSGMPYANRAVRVMLDGDAIRNDVTVVDSSARTVNVRDTDSITQNGIAAETFETVLVDIDSAQELAQRTVTIFADPDLDLEPITIQGQYDPSYWNTILGSTDLLRKFTFKRTPAVGSQIVRQMLVQQVTWNITPSTWECTIKGSARYTGWFTVGASLVGGSDVIL